MKYGTQKQEGNPRRRHPPCARRSPGQDGPPMSIVWCVICIHAGARGEGRGREVGELWGSLDQGRMGGSGRKNDAGGRMEPFHGPREGPRQLIVFGPLRRGRPRRGGGGGGASSPSVPMTRRISIEGSVIPFTAWLIIRIK